MFFKLTISHTSFYKICKESPNFNIPIWPQKLKLIVEFDIFKYHLICCYQITITVDSIEKKIFNQADKSNTWLYFQFLIFIAIIISLQI